MVNAQLIKMFKTLENKLLANVGDSFYWTNGQNNDDAINDFLLRYIKLKRKCKKKIKELQKNSLTGKTIVITGGSSGIGEYISILCKKLNADVIVLDIKKPSVRGVRFFPCDVTNKTDVCQVAKNINKVDYLVTCAGLFAFDENMSQADKERMFDVNVEGTKNCISEFFDSLKHNNGGICAITSGLCKTIDPTCLTYCITKREIMKFLNTIKNKKVKVNAVLPGPVLTPLLIKDINTLRDLAEYCGLNPEKYAGCPEDIALGVIDLILTGADNVELAIDGGESKMFKKKDNKYWVGTEKPLQIYIRGKKYVWELDKTYK